MQTGRPSCEEICVEVIEDRPKDISRLVKAEDFIPAFGLKRLLWDRLPYMKQDKGETLKTGCYVFAQTLYHGAVVCAPITMLIAYFTQ
jgi:hypothetical protein